MKLGTEGTEGEAIIDTMQDKYHIANKYVQRKYSIMFSLNTGVKM